MDIGDPLSALKSDGTQWHVTERRLTDDPVSILEGKRIEQAVTRA